MSGKLRLKLTGPLLAAKSRETLVQSALKAKRYVSAPPSTPERVRVGVIQLPFKLVTSAEAYADLMHEYALRAVQDGAQLLVYPEYTGLHLLGLLPGMENLPGNKSLAEGVMALGDGINMGDVLHTVSTAAHQVYLETFSLLAARFKAYIIAGSIIVSEGRALYNLLHLFAPDGSLVGTQKKLHLSLNFESGWGLNVGQQIEVFALPFGKLAASLSTDHHYFEPQRLAWLRGAEILADASAQATPYHDFEQQRAVWARVQENPCYGILASLVGKFANLTFGGKSGIYAPLELTPHEDGVIAEMQQADQPGVVVAELSMEALRSFRQDMDTELNFDMLGKYIPSAYQSYWERNRQMKR